MLPAAVVDATIDQLVPLLDRDDTIIDGGNTHYHDDIRRAKALAAKGLHYVDMGTSGGVWGLERGYCLMIGGESAVVKRLDPIFAALAPGRGDIPSTPGREGRGGTAEHGYLHCGAAGAGHFVKMVHNGIEYGLMAAYAEGLNILQHANLGARSHDVGRRNDAAPTPRALSVRLRSCRRHRSLAARQRHLVVAPGSHGRGAGGRRRLDRFEGRVADSGEGRWTIAAANEEGVPAHVLTAALFERFASRGEDDFQNRVLSAMRFAFGGHAGETR